MLETPAETEAKAGVLRSLYVRGCVIPLESIKAGPKQPRCKLLLTPSSVPEPVFPQSPGNVEAEESVSKIIWGFLALSSQFLSLQVTSDCVFKSSSTVVRIRNA